MEQAAFFIMLHAILCKWILLITIALFLAWKCLKILAGGLYQPRNEGDEINLTLNDFAGKELLNNRRAFELQANRLLLQCNCHEIPESDFKEISDRALFETINKCLVALNCIPLTNKEITTLIFQWL